MDEKPVLLDRLRPVWEAWQTLSVSRPIISTGFGAAPGTIPFGDIDRYAVRFGPEDPTEFEELLFLLRAMDATYLKHESERVKKEAEDAKKKGSGSRPGNRRQRRPR